MADIFISYSKPDRDKVATLAAYLEAEGWTVWWDRALTAGEGYRDEIMQQLSAARAVIVLWTQNSVASDFVRAEAGRAKADGKLIPVKTADVSYHSIPLPFGEMHTESLTHRELIRAAVVGQLAKPQTAPSGIYLATASVRYAALTWFGIIGGAITLFSNLKGVIQLADWARVLVEQWSAWTHVIWRWLFAWLWIDLPKEWGPLLTFLAFMLSAFIGTYWSPANAKQGKADVRHLRPSFPKKHLVKVLGLSAFLVVYSFISTFAHSSTGVLHTLYRWALEVDIFAILVPLGVLVFLSRDRIGALLYFVVYYAMWLNLGVDPANLLLGNDIGAGLVDNLVHRSNVLYAGMVICFSIAPLALLLLPAHRLNRRLLFVLIGLGLLLGLNEVSKLHLGHYLKA